MRGTLIVLFGLALAVGTAASQPEATLDPATVLQEWSARMRAQAQIPAGGWEVIGVVDLARPP